jgi:hypothetical protein
MRTVQSAADFNEANIKDSEFVNAATLALPELTGPNDTIRLLVSYTGTGAQVDVKLGTVELSSAAVTGERTDEFTLIVVGASDAFIFSEGWDIVEDTTNDYTTTEVALTVTGAQADSVYLAYGI